MEHVCIFSHLAHSGMSSMLVARNCFRASDSSTISRKRCLLVLPSTSGNTAHGYTSPDGARASLSVPAEQIGREDIRLRRMLERRCVPVQRELDNDRFSNVSAVGCRFKFKMRFLRHQRSIIRWGGREGRDKVILPRPTFSSSS